MPYQVTWREVNLGHMIVGTEEEEAKFCISGEGRDMDDPRYIWKKKVFDVDYVEMTTKEGDS